MAAADLRLPVFSLPDVVFFPETVLPLHVFEPRYRRMIADCLAGDRWLAVAMLRPGWEREYEGRPPIHEVAGAGEIIQAQALPDGRFNVLLDGRMRVRIEEEAPGGRPYRVARARRLADVGPQAMDRAFGERLRALRAVYGRLLVALGQSHADLVGRVTVAGARPGPLIDRVVSAVIPDAAVRQEILETADVDARLARATATLGELLALVVGPAGEDGTDDA